MSPSVCMLPLIAGLSFFSQDNSLTPWQSTNDAQQHFLDTLYPNVANLDKLSIYEMQGCTSSNLNEVNAFLKSNNFSMQLEQGGDKSIYLASILNVLFEWGFECAEITELTGKNDKNIYSAIKIPEKLGSLAGKQYSYATCFQVLTVEQYHDRGIFKLPSKQGDFLYITPIRQNNKANQPDVDKAKSGDFLLLEHIEKISTMLKKGSYQKHDGLVKTLTIPMIDLNAEITHDWMIGMKNEPYFVNQALQQIRFKLDEKGARVESGFAAEMALCESSDMILNEPFFLWIEREGIDTPIFAAYLDEESWKDPQNRFGNDK